jgi:O-acetyl-ADP-ribose deacetylase (regulator of RNase III)
MSQSNEQALVEKLLQELRDMLTRLGVKDHAHYDAKTKRTLLDAAITVLPPHTLSESGITRLNQLLQSELSQRELFDANALAQTPFFNVGHTKVVLWQGDITTLKVDAIVNAANNQLLGCFQPQHKCIDNVIHNRAGVQLRNDCHAIMSKQGHVEATGDAKLTRAYNLPSNYVIHTVGPIVQGEVTTQTKTLLAACYNSVLDIAKAVDAIRSIAFCAISTGVFGYPLDQAAPVAIQTVGNWLKEHPDQLDIVIFNVFRKRDLHIYQSVMEAFACQP